MKVRPLKDKVLLKIPSKKEEITKNGIVIPSLVESLNYSVMEGTVLAVGDGRLSSDGTRGPVAPVEPGDTLYVGRYAGTRFYIEGQLVMTIDPKEILGVKEDD